MWRPWLALREAFWRKALRGGLGWPCVEGLAGLTEALARLAWGLDWPYRRPLVGGPYVEGFMSSVSVCGHLIIVYPLRLMWTPWLSGDAKGLAGRALHGGFGLGARALVELYGDFGQARWRPQFVCVEKKLWGLELLWKP